MANVTEKIQIAASAADVWGMIGEFHGLPSWHPLISQSERVDEGGVEYRHLTMADGAVVVESKDAHDDEAHTSTYTMTEMGPLPLASYQATIAVEDAGEGSSIITWSGNFEPKGAPEADVAQAVSGIYTSGLGAVVERFGEADAASAA